MSWNGNVPTQANWSGNPQFAGDEVLYTTPSPANTTTDPSIGIVDGNLIPLPTSYNTLNVATLNSVSINNSGNINTATINGNPVPTSAENWSLYDAIHDVTARGVAVSPYVPRQLYGTGLLIPNLASFGTPYQNYTALETGGTINPGNTLDDWNSGTFYTPTIFPLWGATYNGVQYLATNMHDNDPPPSANWRLANYDNTYSYGTSELAYDPTTKIWYIRTNAGSGNPPPNASYWNVFNFWGIFTNPFPAFDLKGFRNVNCGTVNNVTTNSELSVNTATANVSTLIDMGSTTTNGTFKMGANNLNPAVGPEMKIGNGTVGKCAVEFFGQNNLTGFNAVKVNGGFTVDAGAASLSPPLYNHGIALYTAKPSDTSDPALTALVSLTMNITGTNMINVGPPINIRNRAGQITINSTAGTQIEAGTGLYVTGITPLSYDGGRMFIEHICPPYTGLAGTGTTNLLIDGNNYLISGTRAKVVIKDGQDWETQNLTTQNLTTQNLTAQNLTVTNLGTFQDILTADNGGINAGKVTTRSFVNIPESQNLPPDWNAVANYDLWDFVLYAPTSTYYFSLIADNLNNDPSTSPGSWLLANWDVATTYDIDYPTYEPLSQTFWISLLNGNAGNFPLTPVTWYSTTSYDIDELVVYEAAHYKSLQNFNLGNVPNEPAPLEWDSGTTYAIDELVTFGGLRYKSLQNANTGNDPSTVGSVWWVEVPIWWENIPIYWSPTTNYNLGNTDTGVVFTPIVPGFTGITTLVKRVGDPDPELNVIVKNSAGVELSAQSVVVTPMYKDFDMNGFNILNASITYTNLTINGNLYIHDVYDRTGGNIQFHSNVELATNVLYASGVSVDHLYVDEIGVAGDPPFSIRTDVNMDGNTLIYTGGVTNYYGALDIVASGGINISATSGSNVTIDAGDVIIVPALNKYGTGIVACPSITSNGGLTLTALSGNLIAGATGYTDIQTDGALTLNSTASTASLSAAQEVVISSGTSYISLTSASGYNIQAQSPLDMSTYNIINCPQITGTGTITVASGGTNTNVALTPNGTGLIVANKGLNMTTNSITNCRAVTSDTDLSLNTGTGGVITLNGHNLINAPAILNSGGIGLAASGGDISLAPGTSASNTNFIQMYNTLNLNNNLVTNVAKLNGRNLFSYGNFYNTATQTLGATNTATRVVMNTSLNNNLITLDTTTNIGRITFTNAGVYHVVWNAYLLHGSGGTVKSCIWIRLNGTDVAGSGKTENNDAQQNETNLTSSSMVSVTAGQYIEFYWAANSVNVPLTAVAASSPYPATPSFSCSISIVG